MVADRRRSCRGWWRVGTRDDETRERSTQEADRCCWLRERFSGSSAGRPRPLPCVGEELLRGQLCCGRQKTGSSVVCRGAVLACSFCESGRRLAEDKGRLWAATWFSEGRVVFGLEWQLWWGSVGFLGEGEEDLPGWREKKPKIKNPLQPGVSLVLVPRQRKGG